MFPYALLQLFLTERVDKLNSLTGSGLATCLQEAEESVLLCFPSSDRLMALFTFPPVESMLRHSRKNGLRGQEFCTYEIVSSVAISRFMSSDVCAGTQFSRKWSGILHKHEMSAPTDVCGDRFTALVSRHFVPTLMHLSGR